MWEMLTEKYIPYIMMADWFRIERIPQILPWIVLVFLQQSLLPGGKIWSQTVFYARTILLYSSYARAEAAETRGS
jgi:hypothetical protein